MSNFIDPMLGVTRPDGSEKNGKKPWRYQCGTSTDVETPRREELAVACSPSMAATQAGGLADPQKNAPLSIKGDEQGVVAKKSAHLHGNHLHQFLVKLVL